MRGSSSCLTEPWMLVVSCLPAWTAALAHLGSWVWWHLGWKLTAISSPLFFRSFDVDCICTIGCLGSQAYWLQILTLLSLPSLVNQFLIINVCRYIFLSWNLYTEVCTFWFWWFQPPYKLELLIHWWRIPRGCHLLYFFLFHFSK